MNRTILLAIGGLAAGFALSMVGTRLLGRARAVAKRVDPARRRIRADLKQYAAALLALIGFLLVAGGGALLTRELTPLSDPLPTVVAAVVGVLLFAGAGVGFSRVADSAEESRARRIPPPTGVPDSGAPTSGAPVSGAPTSGQPAPGSEPASQPSAAETPRPTSSPPASDETASPKPLPPIEVPLGGSIETSEVLLRAVRPGWIYRDHADHWYLGVVDEHTRSLPLMRLPEFSLARAGEPTYPLVVAGAGEVAVVPLPEAIDTEAIDTAPSESGSPGQ